jgi:phosphatidate cytidylyltransferase
VTAPDPAGWRQSRAALVQRVGTALVLVAGLLVVLFALPRQVAILVLALALLGGAWEWAGFAGAGATGRTAYAAGIAALMALAWWAVALDPRLYRALLWAAVLWWLVALGWLFRFPTRIPLWLIVACGALVLVPAWLALAHLLLGPDGREWLLFVFVLVWAADIGAFFAGRAFGRVRLAPRVSPGKTWEGVIGGLLLATAAAAAGAWWFAVPASAFVGLCLAVALASIVGDLTVSMFKRHAGLKDSGDLLPGHGGILDRIDSLMAAGPLFVLGVAWVEAA